jgi:alkaline phosphatase
MKGKIKDLLEKTRKTKTEEDYLREEEQSDKDYSYKTPKVGTKPSQVKTQSPAIDIKENAYKILNDKEEQKQIAWDLTSRLLGLFKDKTLNENKDAKMREEESKVLSDFTEFARIINTAPNEEDSLGSLSFAISLARCMLIQRDTINELNRDLFLLRKELEKKLTT